MDETNKIVKQDRYKIVNGTPQAVDNEVNQLFDEGWLLYEGAISVSPGIVGQPMINRREE